MICDVRHNPDALVRIALTFFGLSVLLTACGHRGEPQSVSADAKLRNSLTGIWNAEQGVVTLAPDGTFASRFTNVHSNPMQVRESDGTWQVADGVLIYTVAKSLSWGTTNREAEGTVDRCTIISVDGQKFIWEWRGQTNSMTRGG